MGILRKITSCKCSSYPLTVPSQLFDNGVFSAITRTLNAQYQNRSYGLGSASTTYPVSAFITDLVYLEGTTIHVNVDRITVCSVSDLEDG